MQEESLGWSLTVGMRPTLLLLLLYLLGDLMKDALVCAVICTNHAR